jgi:hypothetical protein
MNTQTLFLKQSQSNPSVGELLTRGWNWKTVGALFGLGGGILSPLLGGAVTLFEWLSASTWHGVRTHRLGVALFVLTFPLLVFGAHCLDLIDRDNRSRRSGYSMDGEHD